MGITLAMFKSSGTGSVLNEEFITQVNGVAIAAIDNLVIVGLMSSDPGDVVILNRVVTFKIFFSEIGKSPNDKDKEKGINKSNVTGVEGISLAKERPIFNK